MIRKNSSHIFLLFILSIAGLTDLSLADAGWNLIYSSDFSSDPGWTTNNASNYYWDSGNQAYKVVMKDASDEYGSKSITWDGCSFKFEFDVKVVSLGWAGDIRFGLMRSGRNMENQPYVWFNYARGDLGYGVLVRTRNDLGQIVEDSYYPSSLELNVWYHNMAVYDASTAKLTFQITKVSDGSVFRSGILENVGTITGLSELGVSKIGDNYSPGATGDGYIDNVEFYTSGCGSETFSTTGSMSAARCNHTATLLPNGKVLVAGGWTGSTHLSSTELYDPIAVTFSTTGSMNMGRYYYSATLLPNGKVLVAGGINGGSYISSAELYDPALGTFAATSSMNAERAFHTATLLPNGKVLVTGGYNDSIPLSSAELYDPAAGTFTTTGSMSSTRREHTATLLSNGKVLVTGGCSGNTCNTAGASLSSAELYDPSAGTFSTTGSMSGIRKVHTATLLPNGKVLVTGGYTNGIGLSSAELYDSSAGIFATTGSMNDVKFGHKATLLPNGKVLVTGGYDGSGYLSSTQLYDPAAGTFATTGTMSATRQHHTATLLSNGKVLVAGGYNDSTLSSAELYDTMLGLGSGIITGKITKSDGTTPISGALVEALQSGVVKSNATTGINGDYSITVATGTCDVRVTSNGYITAIQTNKVISAGQITTVNFALNPSGTTEKPDLVVLSIVPSTATPVVSQTVAYTVTIKNQGSAAVNSVFWIDFYKNLTNAPALQQVGDKYWSVNSLGIGATTQFNSDFVYTGGVFNLYAQVDSNSNIAESNESNNISGPVAISEQAKSGYVSGKVISQADGKAVQSAVVLAKQGADVIKAVSTNIEGSYLLSLSSGGYTLEVIATGYKSSSTAVAVVSERTIYKDFALSPASGNGIITGIVTKTDGVTAIPGARVEIRQNSSTIQTTQSNAIGIYRVIISTGTYDVLSTANGYQTKTQASVQVNDGESIALDFKLDLIQTSPPEPTTDLAVIPLDDSKIFLSWTPSVSGNVSVYRIYYTAGSLDYTALYYAPQATVSHPERTWTSPILNRGETYYFSVRPVTAGGAENLDTNNIASAVITEKTTGPKVVIKVPQTGKKVSGNRLTIVAEAVQEPLNVSKVKFMYKPSHLENWEIIPIADAVHPNPDISWPYFIHWELVDNSGTALSNGNYDLAAIAYDVNNIPDPSPMSITISINNVDMDIEEKLVAGKQQKKEKIRNEKDNITKVGGTNTDALTEVKIASGALNQSSDYVNVTVDPSLSSKPIGNLAEVVEARDVSLASGQKSLNEDCEITIPYKDSNSDGIVDGTNVKEDNLEIWSFDSAANRWKKENDVTINKTQKFAKVSTEHFSTFALVSPGGAVLSQVKVYPSPVKARSGHDRATFAGLTGKDVHMRIFNIAGELVFEKEHIASASYDWLLKNKHEQNAASGIYLYLITDSTGDKVTGKFGIIR